MRKRIITFISLVIVPFITIAQKIPDDFCISKNEHNLFNKINEIRADYDKNEIQLSKSLSYVASVHIVDLETNHPDTSICTSSSWSDKGNWTPCCYNSYVHDPDCMWEKPKELTNYQYRGYELITFFEEEFTIDSIINLWTDSRDVLDMILTRGRYEKKKWLCGGLSIGNNYVSVWFGQRRDSQPQPEVCADEGNNEDNVNSRVTVTEKTYYYLIIGSYVDLHSAKVGQRDVDKNEFDGVGILQGNNKFRLYLGKYKTLKEAMFAKQHLPFKYKDAWILKD